MSHVYEMELGGRTLTIETGELAQQAGGAVTLRYGDTMLLGVVTASKPRRGIDFFPLSVEFEERLYSAGRIPGSFFRREGRPTTAAVLSARLTDRPLRPLFPKGYMDDTQIVITVLSVDMENPPDTLGTIAGSAALTLSDVPFDGPVASVRIGRVDGELIVQPTWEELAKGDLNLVVAGTKDAIMMVEAEAGEVPESLLVEAMALGQEAITAIVQLQEQMLELAKPKRAFTPETVDPGALAKAESAVGRDLEEALSPSSGLTKAERDEKRKALRTQLLEGVEEAEAEDLSAAFESLERVAVRREILENGARPDGRGTRDLRPLSGRVGVVPRTHGSALFQRGETQVLTLTTLAGTGMAQRLDDLTPDDSKRFMHHYNFPPYSVGETGRIGSTGRRELGHGMLGERAMASILPDVEDFPYTIRLVSEVLSSNGSTSMASVCASVMSMMDAGVPIKKPIAGIAMGLIKGEGADDFAVLTDIAGLEDHLGDMDFKVAGSQDGVTALQMDIKVKGIELSIMEQALAQARDARLEIIDLILDTIPQPREEMSPYAPRMHRVEVPQEKDRGDHRPRRQDDPRDRGRLGRGHRHQRRRCGLRHGRGSGVGREGDQRHSGADQGSGAGREVHRQGDADSAVRRLRGDSARQGRAGAHLRAGRLPRAVGGGRGQAGRRDGSHRYGDRQPGADQRLAQGPPDRRPIRRPIRRG